MLELAILGLLKEEPMHGYQLSRELGDSLGGFWRVSYGSLYPTLRRLEKDGAVIAEVDPTGRGRRKTTYRITDEGERIFLELLQETPHDNTTEDTRFRVRLAFFRYLPPETRIRLLERRRVTLEDYSVSNRGLAAGLVGTPESVAERIIEFERVGVNLLLLQCSPQLEEMERFAEEVIPLVNSAVPA